VLTDADIALAHALADAAGAAIRPFWRAEFGLETKADATPVTLADRAAEAAMRKLLAAERPRDGIIGEEYGEERADASRVWVLDPIDGTTSFVAGRPIFGTLIALMIDGWPVLGVIDQPIGHERWIGATGRATEHNGAAVTTRRCRELGDAVLGTTSPHAFSDHEGEHFLNLAQKVARRRIIYGGDCYTYGLVASGHVDIVVEAGLKLHDYAALVPVVEGAGGTMCDWAGNPLNAQSAGGPGSGSGASVIALGDPARLDDVMEALACRHG
jgi:inositol-phosphate phosphatase / L-galactose 1-phosphate phosphatase / histidinol-phosphatase